MKFVSFLGNAEHFINKFSDALLFSGKMIRQNTDIRVRVFLRHGNIQTGRYHAIDFREFHQFQFFQNPQIFQNTGRCIVVY